MKDEKLKMKDEKLKLKDEIKRPASTKQAFYCNR
jgi:hypothetical protein